MNSNELCRLRNDKNPPDRNRGEQLKTQACNKAGGSNSKGSGFNKSNDYFSQVSSRLRMY
jgi:hypothetical protein